MSKVFCGGCGTLLPSHRAECPMCLRRQDRIEEVRRQHSKHMGIAVSGACLECDLIREIDRIQAIAVQFQCQLQAVECEWRRWAASWGEKVSPVMPRLRSIAQCQCGKSEHHD